MGYLAFHGFSLHESQYETPKFCPKAGVTDCQAVHVVAKVRYALFITGTHGPALTAPSSKMEMMSRLPWARWMRSPHEGIAVVGRSSQARALAGGSAIPVAPSTPRPGRQSQPPGTARHNFPAIMRHATFPFSRQNLVTPTSLPISGAHGGRSSMTRSHIHVRSEPFRTDAGSGGCTPISRPLEHVTSRRSTSRLSRPDGRGARSR